MQFIPTEKCEVCGWGEVIPSILTVRENLCGVCSYLIPEYIPKKQYMRYICSLLLNKYDYVVVLNKGGKLTKASSDKVLLIVSGLIVGSLDPL